MSIQYRIAAARVQIEKMFFLLCMGEVLDSMQNSVASQLETDGTL